MELRLALPQQAQTCYRFIEEARAYQSALGFTQWTPTYPTLATVEEDIRAKRGYLFTLEGQAVGYCCLICGDEPTYHDITGAWRTERPYAVVHRLAFSAKSRGHGLSRAAFAAIKDLCQRQGIDAIRISTPTGIISLCSTSSPGRDSSPAGRSSLITAPALPMSGTGRGLI